MTFIAIGFLMMILFVIFIAAVGCLVGAIGWAWIEEDRKTGLALFVLSMFLFWLFFSIIAWMACIGS